jgi:hypothetical protein
MLGDGNVVHAQFSELRARLDELKAQITTAALDEKQKFNVVENDSWSSVAWH